MRRLRILLPLLLGYAALAFGATSITTASLPGGQGVTQVGVAYSASLSASGYTGTLTWTVASSVLPPGYVLDEVHGVICTGTLNSDLTASCTGVATTPGQYTFTIEASPSGTGGNAFKQFSITVLEPGAPSITSGSVLPNAVAGQAYSFQFAETGGQSPYTWLEASSSIAYPPGFTLNAATGVFSKSGRDRIGHLFVRDSGQGRE